MLDIVGKILDLHTALADANIPHAFGGALALAWCTHAARGTIDIDINILAGENHIDPVLNQLPSSVTWSTSDRKRLQQDLQHRLFWDKTPLDLFFNSTEYHNALADRVVWERFAGEQLPFLSCLDLAVFKAFFNRTKDWADLEAMYAARSINVKQVKQYVASMLGPNDPRIGALDRLRD